MPTSFDKKTIGILTLFAVGMVSLFLFGADKNVQEVTVFEFENSVYSSQTILGEGYQKFTHPTYTFSVEYPDYLATEAFHEKDNGETIVFQSQEGDFSTGSGQDKTGFQIFITPFGEDEVITRDRILEDIPFATVDEPQEVIIGDNIRALLFWSEDPLIGRTREVWFVHDSNLYEITTYAEFDSLLVQVLSSWRFEN